jgi:chemotaxis protein MotB
MSKKKHPEHVNHERWLVSYADFITLLFAFFVVLFASGQSDKAKQKKISVAITQAFSQMAMFDPHSKTPPIADTTAGGAGAQPNPVELPITSTGDGDGAPKTNNALPEAISPQALRQRVQDIIQKQITTGSLHPADISLHASAEGLTLSLQEGGFFDSGSAEIRPAAISTLQTLAASLPTTPLRIEGHTDNLPMRSPLYASNWELSTARACAIARFLLDHSSENPTQLSVAGYAEFHPVAPNTTPEGRAKNRRVDIVFLQPPPTTTQISPAISTPTPPTQRIP